MRTPSTVTGTPTSTTLNVPWDGATPSAKRWKRSGRMPSRSRTAPSVTRPTAPSRAPIVAITSPRWTEWVAVGLTSWNTRTAGFGAAASVVPERHERLAAPGLPGRHAVAGRGHGVAGHHAELGREAAHARAHEALAVVARLERLDGVADRGGVHRGELGEQGGIESPSGHVYVPRWRPGRGGCRGRGLARPRAAHPDEGAATRGRASGRERHPPQPVRVAPSFRCGSGGPGSPCALPPAPGLSARPRSPSGWRPR